MSHPKTGAKASADVATLVMQEQDKFRSLMSEWMVQQRKQQEQFIESMLQVHRETLFQLQGKGSGAPAKSATISPPEPPARENTPLMAEEKKKEALPGDAPKDMEEVETIYHADDHLMDFWKRSSGLHTVVDWVSNYQKHPAGWAALFMIHGIPEVTGRLRSKVDNFSIYSALFLSMSIACLIDVPDSLFQEPHEEWSIEWWFDHVRARAYIYGLAIGTASHMLSILLGMAFCNALNEAARDSDVYRMFARGQGFFATVKCERAFQIGCAADYVAVIACTTSHLIWQEVLIACGILLAVPALILFQTKGLLFSSSSIVNYWREDLGGKPDAGDPFDLGLAVDCFKARVQADRLLMRTRPEKGSSSYDHDEPSDGGGMAREIAVAGIF